MDDNGAGISHLHWGAILKWGKVPTPNKVVDESFSMCMGKDAEGNGNGGIFKPCLYPHPLFEEKSLFHVPFFIFTKLHLYFL